MVTVRKNVPLAPLTTFRVGGKADYFVETTGALELAEAFEYAEQHDLPVRILGGGSNVIFPDAGFHGMIIRMRDGGIKVSGERILCGAGVSLFDVVRAAAAAGLTGIERLAGIPGSFGGAVRGNAGAFGTEIGDVVASVKVLLQDTGMVKEYRHDACGFGYRTSIFKKKPALIILSAEIRLVPGEKQTLEKIIADTVAMRESKHPQDAQCAGSFFINPIVKSEKLRHEFEKDTGMAPRGGKLPAGWLIDHVGLRGKRIGGAMISDKHPNYLVNTGDATAEDVMILASLVKTRVRDELRVKLQEEVQFVGF
ncbi:MAG: UDP-N-acetylmuramate dehydrogenase [Candidatus Moraniibacteriota bacterium]